MNDDRQTRLDEIYDAALRLDASRRLEYVRQACGDDDALCTELESMLVDEERLGSFLEKPAFNVASTATTVESLIGTMMGPYKVEGLLGAGGMGMVYRARDTRLGRAVAIKLASREFSSRFLTEARAVAALNHPHVCTLHDIGPNYLVMELLEGETLEHRLRSGPLPLDQVVRCGFEIADALAATHGRGIIHRDLKPGNIMLTGTGIKVLDFGLAKRLPASLHATNMPTESLEPAQPTTPGLLMGTVAYMSPEQARGEELDARTDLFSLGVVLYEIATGKHPFEGPNHAVIFDGILNRDPMPIRERNPGLPAKLDEIVAKALEKNRDLRYQHAADIGADLKRLEQNQYRSPPSRGPTRKWAWLGAVGVLSVSLIAAGVWQRWLAPEAVESLAVLPLANDTGDPSADYIGDGITDDLINSISQVPKVTVISRSSVSAYKGAKPFDAQKIGRRLGVRAVLTGVLEKKPTAITVSVELVDVASNRHLWGKRYEESIGSLSSIGAEVSADLAGKLTAGRALPNQRPSRKRAAVNADAYQMYVKGRYYWNKRTQEGFRKAIECFRQAIDMDPAYAMAYSGLSDCYMWLAGNPGESYPKAKAAARKALDIDDSLAPPHATLGYISFLYDWNWPEAQHELTRAIELDPNYATAHSMYARYLSAMGRSNEAVRESTRAVALDPLSLPVSTGLGLCYYFGRRFGDAITQYKKTLDMDPNFPVAREHLALALLHAGQAESAIREFKKLVVVDPGDTEITTLLAYAYAYAGRHEAATQELRKLQKVPASEYIDPYFMAFAYGALDRKDEAFKLLNQAYDNRAPDLALLRVEPDLDVLRSDPRFTGLLKRLKLE